MDSIYDKNGATAHERRAAELFLSGYNCAQSVFAAFSDVTGYSEEESLKIASSFGAGMGAMREVCGAVSGILMTAGILYGYTEPGNPPEKKEHYERVRLLAGRVKEKFGTIICRDMLAGLKYGYTPQARDEEYYKKRPCAAVCAAAARVLDEYIAENTFTRND